LVFGFALNNYVLTWKILQEFKKIFPNLVCRKLHLCFHKYQSSGPTPFAHLDLGDPKPIKGTSNRTHKGPAMDSWTDIVRAQQLLQLLNMIEVLSKVTRQRRTWPPYQTGIKQFQMDRMRNRQSWPIAVGMLMLLLLLRVLLVADGRSLLLLLLLL